MKTLKISALALAVFAGAATTALAWTERDRDTYQDRAQRAWIGGEGYLRSVEGIARNGFGECWKTGTYTTKDGVVECGDTKAVVRPAPVAPTAKPVVSRPSMDKVTLSSKVLFGFNSAVLAPNARTELDPIVNRLKSDANFSGMEIQGHTDYLGSAAYNQTLSQKRAEAVKAYFANSGIPAERMVAVGRGKMDEKMSSVCKQHGKTKKAKAALQACLEPDRRVELLINTAKEVTTR